MRSAGCTGRRVTVAIKRISQNNEASDYAERNHHKIYKQSLIISIGVLPTFYQINSQYDFPLTAVVERSNTSLSSNANYTGRELN